MKKLTLNELRQEFEKECDFLRRVKKINYPMGTVEVNGKFIKYMDADTDNAWIGFAIGYRMGVEAVLKKMIN